MKQWMEVFLQLMFVALVIVLPLILVFALLCELFGWYDSNGRYSGPFSKSWRK